MRKLLVLLVLGCIWAAPALAIPTLQVYIEGAEYDQDLDTWVTENSSFRLWVIGNVEAVGTIFDVHLTAAFLTGETGSITVTAAQTALLNDPSMSDVPSLNNSVGADGTSPVMSDGHALPSHGVYGPGVSFAQWDLGNMDKMDSPIGNYELGIPGDFPFDGQINAYDITVTGYSMVHFDAFNHVESANKALFAPNSHDSEYEVVPEPGSLLLVALGLGGLFGAQARRRRR